MDNKGYFTLRASFLGKLLYAFFFISLVTFSLAVFVIAKPLAISTSGVLLFYSSILLILHRVKRSFFAAILFIFALFFVGTALIYVDTILNIYALVALILAAFVAGILFGIKGVVVTYVLEVVTILAITYLQLGGVINSKLSYTDYVSSPKAIIFSASIGIVVIGTYLANREIEKSLERAIQSEKETQKYARELEKEKENLEIKVKERTKALEESQRRRLRELQNIVNVGKISAGLIHDISSPLTVGLARVEEIEKNTGKKEKKSLTSLKTALEKIQTMTLNTRKQIAKQGTNVVFDAVKEACSVIEILTYRASRDNVKIHLEGLKSAKLMGDPIKFSQIILNLLVNAIESYEQIEDGRQKKIDILFKNKKNCVVVRVTDYGFGISEDNIDKIFDPLFTTKQSKAGTGLGLYTTKDYVRELNGRISVKSKQGKGTTFILEFKV